ncbi:MAG TPA: HlyD family efflux transporter periplasmic adaptor subunit [Polyangia bacterium]|nr:HlyD family efflux transporter periplasmic adaptor subunit [Polyangia bacterium]
MPDVEAPPPRDGDPARPPPFVDAPPRPSPGAEPDAEQAKGRARKRKRLRIAGAAGAVVLLGIIGYWLYAHQFESTDDAQVDANISNVGARVGGTVVRVNVVENQRVKANDDLVDIDPTDLGVALAQAKAQVAQATAQLAAEDPGVAITETSNAAALTNAAANISSASAGLAGAQRDVDQAVARLAEVRANQRTADLELQRGQELVAHDAIPRAEYDRRESAAKAAAAVVEGAQKSVLGARARVAQQEALMSGIKSRLTEVRQNSPRQVESRQATLAYRQANLELAKAQQRQAELNLGYATVRTPVAGIVARKSVNVGDAVTVGQALAAITQTDDVWVTANFRETQLRRMRPGQRATIHVDALARDFGGWVESTGGATGSRTSLFPPENATDNYVKVVQRIPVRIRFDAGQEGLDLLRPGMSVEPKVRVIE